MRVAATLCHSCTILPTALQCSQCARERVGLVGEYVDAYYLLWYQLKQPARHSGAQTEGWHYDLAREKRIP
jgi:hypothetical protein